MINHDVRQGSEEWRELRLGKPTASCFHRIVTPSEVGLSVQSASYAWLLIAERLLGYPIDSPTTALMDRGSTLEAEAVRAYEFLSETRTVKVGFLTTDDGRIGASPDRLVGSAGLLEAKCPASHNHVGYLLGSSGKLDGDAWSDLEHAERRTGCTKSKARAAVARQRIMAGQGCAKDHWPQVQGQLWISEREWCDILSYHPGMCNSVVRVERDDAYIRLLSESVSAFADAVDAAFAKLYVEAPRKPISVTDVAEDWLRITDADLAAILASRQQAITAGGM